MFDGIVGTRDYSEAEAIELFNSEGVDGELRRDEHRVDPGVLDLGGQPLAGHHVTGQGRTMAVEEQHHHAGLVGVKGARNVEQGAAIGVGLVIC